MGPVGVHRPHCSAVGVVETASPGDNLFRVIDMLANVLGVDVIFAILMHVVCISFCDVINVQQSVLAIGGNILINVFDWGCDAGR
jgi:hypothetical protein